MRARISMRWMVTLFTGFFLAACLGLALGATLRQVREQWARESLVYARTGASLLARTSTDALRRGDLFALQQMAIQVAASNDVERVMVMDRAGEPIADSASDEAVPKFLAPSGLEQSRACTDGHCVEALAPVTHRDEVLGAVYVRCSVSQHRALLKGIVGRLVEVGLFAIFAGCFIAYATAGLISGPLRRLANNMGEIAVGRLPQEVVEEGCYEMRHMARSFNHMSSVLQHRATEMGSLADLSLAVLRSLDLATVTKSAVESVEQGLPGARAQIWLPDAERQYLVLAGGPGLREDAVLLTAHSVLARAFHGREAIVAGGDEAAVPVDPWFTERFGAGSAIAVPLSVGPDPVGLLVAYRPQGEQALPADDVPFLSAAAHQIALAIENARLYGRQERMASVFRRLLHPAPAPAIPELDIAVRWRPARGEGAVGGDYYDFIALPNGRWGIVIGDVCGKGVLAASYTTMAKHVLRSYAYETDSPAEILQRTNGTLYAQLINTGDEPAPIFVTILCALYEPRTGRLVYSHAGHPLGTLARLNSVAPTVLSAGGPPVGVMPDSTYNEQVLYMAPGDTLALYTDGVVEASRSERVLEPERIAELLSRHQGRSVEDAADALMQVAARMARGRAPDDIALLILRARGDTPPVELPDAGVGDAALEATQG